MNEPIDHHCIPVFYLSRGRVLTNVLPLQPAARHEVKAKRVVPKGSNEMTDDGCEQFCGSLTERLNSDYPDLYMRLFSPEK